MTFNGVRSPDHAHDNKETLMAQDYDELLNQTWEELPVAVLLPAGGWLLKGTTVGFVKPKEEGQSAKVLFTYKAKEPISVADDLLDELPEGYDLDINDVQYTIYIENAGDWDKVRKHLAQHGVTLTGRLFDDNKKLAFAKAFSGTEVIAELGQRSYENAAGETIWQNSVSKFQKVEA